MAALLRRHGISRPTCYLWRSKYPGTTVNELEADQGTRGQNGNLKRMYAGSAKYVRSSDKIPYVILVTRLRALDQNRHAELVGTDISKWDEPDIVIWELHRRRIQDGIGERRARV